MPLHTILICAWMSRTLVISDVSEHVNLFISVINHGFNNPVGCDTLFRGCIGNRKQSHPP